FEPFGEIDCAIQREKTMKKWPRQWKINLIERENPHWQDLFPHLTGDIRA
ncbi:MAG: GIY-YIG nuclease family protein, partial [Aestuariivirga sp.]